MSNVGPRGHQGEKGAQGNQGNQGEPGKVAIAVVVLLAGIVLGLGVNLVMQFLQENRDEEQASQLAEQNATINDQQAALLNTLIEAERLECIDELEGRIESRDRAIATKHLLDFLIDLIAASPVSQRAPETAQEAIDTFTRDYGRIDILPIPSCDDFADELREGLGVSALPPLDMPKRRR